MNQPFEDQDLECMDCRQTFVFTAGEQTFFQEKGFTPPKRCKPCRDAKKQQKASSGGGRFDPRGNR